MELALVLRELWARKLLLAVGVLVAALVAVLSVYRLDGLKLKSRSLQHSSATTQVLVDTPSSVLGNVSQSFDPLNARAVVYANFMASPVVLNLIGQQVGLRGEQLYAAGPVDTLQPRTVQEPTALKRNVQITGETVPFRLNFNSEPNLPTIGVFSQAPTTKQAVALANAAAVGLQRYVATIETANKVPRSERVTIRQLGPASGGVVNGGISRAVAGLVFAVVFFIWCMLVLVGSRFRESWRASGRLEGGSHDNPQQMEDEGGADENHRGASQGAMLDVYPDAHELLTKRGASSPREEGERTGEASPTRVTR
jgi:hypothetical protein